MSVLEAMLAAPAYSLRQASKEPELLSGLNELTRLHYERSVPYRRILDGYWQGGSSAERLADIPYLPVSLFKTQQLYSVPAEQVKVTLTSSGTTGQAVSRIYVDKDTSLIQQRALANSLTRLLGPKRLPMLIIDTDAVFKDPQLMSARGAGVLGLMRFGFDHSFALDHNMQPNLEAVKNFLSKHADERFFIFGFTFMVWTVLYDAMREMGLDLSKGTLIHSGGWKKMADRAVDNSVFRRELATHFGLSRIFNFYGMVEQIGSIFVEGPEGLLYPPNFSDVIIRNPETWEEAKLGEVGVIQVLSLLPRSYPGHSLLTEDLGVVERVDPGDDGFNGKGLRILGRVPRAELRGCSDVIAAEAA